MNRREFIIKVSAAAGGLALALEIPGSSAAAESAASEFRPNIWLRITPDNRVVFVLDRVEMGQGTMTALPMILAEELDVAPEDLTIEFAPADRAYRNPKLAMQMTGGSTSVATAWEPLRKAGATARAMLMEAAATVWGVPLAACATKRGTVYRVADGTAATYGALAGAAAKLPVPSNVALKDPKDFTIIGKSGVRLDALAKSTGRASFGIDTTLPGLRVAVVKRCPIFGGQVKSFDGAVALKMPGVEAVVEIPSGVAIVAQKFWQAKAAAALVTVEWNDGPHAGLSSEQIMTSLAAAAQSQSDQFHKAGAAGKALTGAAKTVFAAYQLPYLAHAAMEPGNCTAHVTDTGCDIWAPTQGPGLAQQLAAEITGFAPEHVRVHTTFIGGGFGRRLYQDFVVEAVHVAKLLKIPVKVMWTREDDMRHDFYRPASVHHVKAALDANGEVTAWAQVVATQSVVGQVMGEWLRAIVPQWIPDTVKQLSGVLVSGLFKSLGQDPTATEGVEDMGYAIPALHVAFAYQEQPIPVGFWRSVGHSYTGFVVESFIDELAHAAGKDPLAFRRGLLKGNPKTLAVLDLAAQKADWGTPLPAGIFRGIAVHTAFGSCVAQVAEVSIGADHSIKVHRVVCAIDCGLVVNPEGVEAQMQGGIVFALSAAFYGEITIAGGSVQQGNFNDYAVLRMSDMPRIDVHVVPSAADPSGAGEPAVPPLAAAVANAVFAATGQRLRSLPLKLSTI